MDKQTVFTIAVFAPIGLCVAGYLLGCLFEFIGKENFLAGTTALGCLAALGVIIWLVSDPAVPKQPLRDAVLVWMIVLLLGGLVGSLALIGAALTDCTPVVILVAMMVAAGIVWLFVIEYNLVIEGYQDVAELAQAASNILQV